MIRKSADRITETRENMRAGTGTITIQHYFQAGEFGAPVRLCAELTIPPGASIGTHEHVNEDEVYIVKSGSGILDDGTHQEAISAGDSVLTGSGGKHAIANNTTDPLVLIAMISLYIEQ